MTDRDDPTRDEPEREPEGIEEPEPEGGPYARQRESLEERLTALGPKPDGRAPRAAARPAGAEPPLIEFEPQPISEERRTPPAIAPGDRPEPPPPARPELMAEYRQRQRRQGRRVTGGSQRSATREGPAEPGDESPGEEEPPEAPAPPPAENWIPIGPSVLRRGQGATLPATSGRTVAIAVAPGGTRVYAGAANGGVWRSEDTGESWRSLMESFDLNPTNAASDSLACGAIALVAGPTATTDVLYVGTGEGAGGAYFGVGPVVSSDGGANWTTEPVSGGSPDLAGTAFYALAVDPADSTRVVAATRQGVYRREPVPGLPGSFHWDQKTLAGAGSMWATSVVAAAIGGTTTFYAASWFGPVHSSTDGHTWTQLGTGFPTTGVGRIGLAVQPDNPTVVYALIHSSANGAILGVWRLDTTDNTWRNVSGHPPFLFGNPNPAVPPGVQGSYDLSVAVDPNNVNRLYLGGSTVQSGGAWSGSIYRCVIASSGSGASLSYSMTPTYIGASTHADVHTLTFAPGDSNKLWAGCDGGVFYSTNPTGTGNVFSARNTGLGTLTMNYLAQHPSEDAVLFSGTQDNGGARFTGEEAWLHSVWGDSGHFVVNWNDPYTVIATYVGSSINRSTDGGTRYNYTSVSLPSNSDPVLFYAPLVGTLPSGTASEAQRVAFGTTRPWISDTFGGGWASIPNGTTADRLGATNGFRIRSMVFASFTRLYVGTMNGEVHRYDQSGGSWSRTQLDTIGGANSLPLAGPVTDIAVDPADTSGDSIYITFGGAGDYRHVWHFDGTQWQQRSGAAAGGATSLLDVQHTAVVVDPANTAHVYVGADMGVWRSTDGGTTWAYFSEGLPDAGVMDLLLHPGRRLLRVATHGRGVYERRIDSAAAAGVELYVRDTQLDQGRFTTVNGGDDPTSQGETVRHWRGPDIKVDTPDSSGNYQFPLTGDIDFLEFVDTITDDFRNVATHATADIISRVYVQVHNRGVTAADSVRVMLLLANASAGLPALPANYWTNVQAGTPITTTDWITVGIDTLDDVRVGSPQVAAFDLHSTDLPPPTSLAGNDHHCVLALIHHVDDPYTSIITNTDNNSKQERKAAHKNLKVVQFTGTLPAPPPVVMAFRIHNADLEREVLTSLRLRLGGYKGRVRLFFPELRLEGDLADSLEGFEIDRDFAVFDGWAQFHADQVERNLEGRTPYNREWSKQRIEALEVVNREVMLVSGTKEPTLRSILMEPGGRHTLFAMFERPEGGEVGEAFPIEIAQLNEDGEVIGALDARIELVPEPEVTDATLRLWAKAWRWGGMLLGARLYRLDGTRIPGGDDVTVDYELVDRYGLEHREGTMKWHRSWASFYAIVRMPLGNRFGSGMRVRAVARVRGRQVAHSVVYVSGGRAGELEPEETQA